jgi:DNA-binding CsgD family transcriptional regulator
MASSQRLTHADLRAAFHLVSDLRESRHDPAVMQRLLIDGLAHLLGSTCGFACEVSNWRPAGDLRITSMTPDSASNGAVAELVRGMEVTNSLWEDPSFAEGVQRTAPVESVPFYQLATYEELRDRYPWVLELKGNIAHVDHLLAWHRTGDDLRDIRGVSIHRWGKRERRFGQRETALAHVVFAELNWLYTSGRLDPPVAGLTDLPPRLADVLGLIRTGLAPKQIAAQLGLSIHTVRDHIKRLYARAGVGDRGAFMALLSGGPAQAKATNAAP